MQEWVLTFGIVWFLIVLAWDVLTDRDKFLSGETVLHKKEASKRMILLTPSGILFVAASTWPLFASSLIVAGLMGFHFWLWFDGISNRLKNLPFFHPGTGGAKNNSWIDENLRKLEWWEIGVIKTGGTLIFSYLYFLLL